VRTIKIHLSDVARCPTRVLSPSHYRVVPDSADGDVECAHGYACEWFALCDRKATGFIVHPILGDVPVCNRCRARAEEGRPAKQRCSSLTRSGICDRELDEHGQCDRAASHVEDPR
jgi:hypothetical protein